MTPIIENYSAIKARLDELEGRPPLLIIEPDDELLHAVIWHEGELMVVCSPMEFAGLHVPPEKVMRRIPEPPEAASIGALQAPDGKVIRARHFSYEDKPAGAPTPDAAP